MADKFIIGKGTTFGFAPITGTYGPDGTSGTVGSYTTVAALTKATFPAMKVGKAEVTTFGDSSDQFLSTYNSTGDIDLEWLYTTAETTVIAAKVGDGNIYSMQFTLPDTHTWTATGFFSEYHPNVEMKQGVKETLKITVSGKAAYA